MTRTIQIRDKMAVQCSQCTNFAETAYVSDDGNTLEIFDVRCAEHPLPVRCPDCGTNGAHACPADVARS